LLVRVTGVNRLKLDNYEIENNIIMQLEDFLKGKGALPSDIPSFFKDEFITRL